MNGSDIFDFVFMLVVGTVFSLAWWRLVWAIRRGDEWKLAAEYRLLNWQALVVEMGDLAEELRTVKKERDELLKYVDQSEENEDYAGAIDGLEF